jgi:hypothetical protein
MASTCMGDICIAPVPVANRITITSNVLSIVMLLTRFMFWIFIVVYSFIGTRVTPYYPLYVSGLVIRVVDTSRFATCVVNTSRFATRVVNMPTFVIRIIDAHPGFATRGYK